MSLRRCPRHLASTQSRPQQSPEDEVYNIIPVHNLLADHPSLRFPEVRAATAALRAVDDLRKPPFIQWMPNMDLLDWLGFFFGFQKENVRNQRENLGLQLANAQVLLNPPPHNSDALDDTVLRRFRKKLLKNYTNWCSYLGKKSYIWISNGRRSEEASYQQRRELLYVTLYLLIWGESANLRFLPECLCYIFHHMAMELNLILEDYKDELSGHPRVPYTLGDQGFLKSVVNPIYEKIKAEEESSKNGTSLHSARRNYYDDINEYFRSKLCFYHLRWPIDVSSNFFVTPSSEAKHLRSRFQFNLMPKEQMLNASETLKNKLKDATHRLKLRYGLGHGDLYKKLEPNQIEANKFSLVWNEIILSLREEDLISDREVQLLEFPPNSWNVRVTRWPCFLLCNEFLMALRKTEELVDGPHDQRVWKKICKKKKNEYRRCAIIEVYDCIKYLILEIIIKPNSKEHSILTVLFQEIDHSLETGRFTEIFKITALPQLHRKLIPLAELLNRPQKDSNCLVIALKDLYEIVLRDFLKDEELKSTCYRPLEHDFLLFDNSIQLPPGMTNNEGFYRQVRRLHTILTCRDSMQDVLVNLEARRRIEFFFRNYSLFMDRSLDVPQVEKMTAFSFLTPYCDEDVLFSEEQLGAESNKDGSTMLYNLQTKFDDEWNNFLERMRREGMIRDSDLWTEKLRDLRLWASYRGQTLARTVRGIMYYYKALKILAFLDSASEMDIQEGSHELGSMSLLFKGHEHGTASMKFTYVVACQKYGTQKKEKDPRADEILDLMKNNEALRVGYVDEVVVERDEKEYYSVLAKYDQKLDKEVEIYRIKLPGPLILGEDRAENQNNAIIFSRADIVKTIDTNQNKNYFEEALKMLKNLW